MKLAFAALLALAPASILAQTHPRELSIAAAADLEPVLPILAQFYEKDTGVKLILSFASSGTLTTQIINGAPMDVFLGADYTFPEKLVAAGLTDQKEPVLYAKGTLVLWSLKTLNAPLTMEILKDPRITKVAIADEFHAPFGRAAYAAIRWVKLYDTVKPKLVTAENVAQTAQFVESGNAQLGFISLTLAESPKLKNEGQYVRVFPSTYPEIRQCGVVLKNSKDIDDARNFLRWMISPKVQENLTKFGLEPVR